MSKIRVAIAGVGNCASALVQGIEYYRGAEPGETVPGLMHVVLGGYHVGDVEVVAAFDVDATKVGLDLGKAIFAGHNNTIRFAEVGDRHAGIDENAYSLEPLLDMYERDESEGEGDMPYPPDYPKMPGEPKRVQPSRDRDRKR